MCYKRPFLQTLRINLYRGDICFFSNTLPSDNKRCSADGNADNAFP